MTTNNNRLSTYPLCWPEGWRRKKSYERDYGKFKVGREKITVAAAVSRIRDELRLFGIHQDDILISSNVRTRLDGYPRSGEPEPADPGVAVYWETRDGNRRCMAIDRYNRVAQNMAAIAATLDAMRAIDRHGGAEILDRAFTGFTALPHLEQWWQVLGFETSQVTRKQIIDAHKRLARRHHPDKAGDGGQMARINVARDEGLRTISK